MCDLFTDVQIRHGLTMNILGINERPLIIYGRKKGGGGSVFLRARHVTYYSL